MRGLLRLAERAGNLAPEGVVGGSAGTERLRGSRRLVGMGDSEQEVLGAREAVPELHRLAERQCRQPVELWVPTLMQHGLIVPRRRLGVSALGSRAWSPSAPL